MFGKKFLKDKDLDIRKHYPEHACIKSHTLTNYRKHGQRLHMNFNSMAGIVLLTSFGDMECHIVKS